MLRASVIGFLICFLTFVSTGVLAQVGRQDKHNYVGVTLGQVLPKDLDSDERYPDRVSLSDVELEDGFFFGAKAGHRVQKLGRVRQSPLAIELEAFVIPGTDIDGEYYYFHPWFTTVDLHADVSIMALMFNVLLRDPYGQVHPYAGGGLGWTWFMMEDVKLVMEPGWEWPHQPTNINEQGDLDSDGLAFQLLLGLDIDLTRSLSVDLGYRYLRAEPEIMFAKGSIEANEITDLDTKMTYKTHMITVGLTYAF
jgi:opacity protein-like surface antigen